MTPEAKKVLISRFKSLLWRVGAMAAAFALAYASNSLELLHLPVWLTGILGLVLGEVTKFVNSNLPWLLQQTADAE